MLIVGVAEEVVVPVRGVIRLFVSVCVTVSSTTARLVDTAVKVRPVSELENSNTPASGVVKDVPAVNLSGEVFAVAVPPLI